MYIHEIQKCHKKEKTIFLNVFLLNFVSIIESKNYSYKMIELFTNPIN